MLGDGTKRVDDRAPIAAGVRRGAELGADEAQKAANGARTVLVPKLRPWIFRLVRLRQQAAAGKNVDAAGETIGLEAESKVNAGEARADQQDLAIFGDVFVRGRGPGIGSVARAGVGEAGDVEVRGREIADGQDDGLRLEGGAVA